MRLKLFVIAILTVACLGFSNAAEAASPQKQAPATQPYLLHLPGIGGLLSIDRAFINGLRDTEWDATFVGYDWTCRDPGLDALLARERNEGEAKKISEKLAEHIRANPDQRVILTSHSGGTGIAVWALEGLPENVVIDTLVLMSPAISPTYDLSKALEHVRGKCYVFSSTLDTLVLGAGTKVFGTIDGVKTESAGLNGFVKPDGAEAKQYAKLVSIPYDAAWMRYGNIGDHIGVLSRRFAREITAPLLREGTMPTRAAGTALAPTTRSTVP